MFRFCVDNQLVKQEHTKTAAAYFFGDNDVLQLPLCVNAMRDQEANNATRLARNAGRRRFGVFHYPCEALVPAGFTCEEQILKLLRGPMCSGWTLALQLHHRGQVGGLSASDWQVTIRFARAFRRPCGGCNSLPVAQALPSRRSESCATPTGQPRQQRLAQA
jgi:hypothetical protein